MRFLLAFPLLTGLSQAGLRQHPGGKDPLWQPLLNAPEKSVEFLKKGLPRQ